MPIRLPAITEPVLDESGNPVLDDDGKPIVEKRLLMDPMSLFLANADHVMGSMRRFFDEGLKAAQAVTEGLRALHAPQSTPTSEPSK